MIVTGLGAMYKVLMVQGDLFDNKIVVVRFPGL